MGPVVTNDPVRDPNLQTMDLMNLIADCLLILTTGVASDHLMNLSMVTYRYRNPPMALGNGPRMSSPHTANGHEGGIICSICAGVWIHLAWNYHVSSLYQLDDILQGCRPVEVMTKGFTDQRVG
jgi:hypothetical protein